MKLKRVYTEEHDARQVGVGRARGRGAVGVGMAPFARRGAEFPRPLRARKMGSLRRKVGDRDTGGSLMDISNCEQYVIARLDEAEAEIARLDAEKAEAEERIAELKREAGKVRGTTEASIVAGMRRAFFDKVARPVERPRPLGGAYMRRVRPGRRDRARRGDGGRVLPARDLVRRAKKLAGVE